MSTVVREQILEALSKVVDPELRRPVTELDMVRGVEVDGGRVTVTIALTVPGCPLRASFQEQVERHVGVLPSVESVRLEFDVMSPEEKAALSARLRGSVTERTKGIALDRSTRVLAIASGKGGVGKSSLTVNLAAAFARLGLRTGVLDADVYGHSIPHMLGVSQRPVVVDQMIIPPVKGDLKLMSIGFFLDENAPIMWRGPMLHRALEQFLSDVHWGELDVLLVDMPPGTGDVSISLGQLLPRAEAVIVTTPQPAAQQVAVRAGLMAQKTNMRVIGVIENMSYLVGSGQELFGSGGGERLAAELGVPLLGKVPLDPRLRECGDAGEPLVAVEPASEGARAILAVAEAIGGTRRESGIGIVKSLRVLSQRVAGDPHAEPAQRLLESVLGGPGELEPHVRRALAGHAALLGLDPAATAADAVPPVLLPYVEKVALHAYRVLDRDVEELRQAGCSEDAVFEATVATALGAGLARLERGLAALGEAGS